MWLLIVNFGSGGACQSSSGYQSLTLLDGSVVELCGTQADVFDLDKPFTQSDLDMILNIYRSLDKNLVL